jgi:small GTP-binding protein
VARFVHSIFSDTYLTTVGVKIDKKSVDLGDQQVDLILWDIHGEDEFQKVRMTYLRGSAGYLLVVDGTRRETLDTALELHDNAQRSLGRVPFVLVINKADLASRWEVDVSALERLGFPIVRTSAKTGEHVEETFASLARSTLAT